MLRDLIAQVNAPGYAEWEAQVRRIGGCAHPLHLRGTTRAVDPGTGVVAWEYSSRDAPGGVLMVRCGNRRATVCPSCARLYQGDMYHLVRAGLAGGKGVPASVTTHPRVFATLTAPSFGAVHTDTDGRATSRRCHPRRTPPCVHGAPTACWSRHDAHDPLVGVPLCGDCYDYRGAVVWQASVGLLWSRFRTYLPRRVGTAVGRTRAEVKAELRLSFVKIVEYQRRGLVHVHAVIRADAARRVDDAAPVWVTSELMAKAVGSAAAGVRVRVEGGPAGSWVLRWGSQVEAHPIDAGIGGAGAGRVAAYVAKYATKGTEVTGWNSRTPEAGVRNPSDAWQTSERQAAHAAAMVRTAIELSEVPELAGLRLGRWAKELAYRGHVSSKSRHYSTTLGALRQARRSEAARSGAAGSDLRVESSWRLVSRRLSPGASVLARGIARDVEINSAAAREAGAARPRAGGWDSARRDPGERERGARRESHVSGDEGVGDR